MALPSGSAYHADSDADDEYEHSVITSPTHLQTDSETSPTDSDPHSTENTPTYGNLGEDASSPRTIITEWTAQDCAQYLASLGLRQYCDAFIEHGIDGGALVALRHDELKQMGIASVGHRLTILKSVYDVKVSQDIYMDPDHYISLSAEQSAQNEPATKEDIERWARSMMKQSEDRIGQAEEQLRALSQAYSKLRQDLVPVFRMAKELSEPLPNVPGGNYSTTSPNVSNFEPPSPLPGQTGREWSAGNKKYTGSSQKNHSPTHIPPSMQERKTAALMSSNALPPVDSPSAPPQPSPTSPVPPYSTQTLANRSYQDSGMTSSSGGWNGNGSGNGNSNGYGQEPRTYRSAPSQTTAVSTPSVASTFVAPPPLSIHGSPSTTSLRPPGSGGSIIPASTDGNAGPARSWRVPPDEPCHRILQAVLRRYDANADPRQYALYIVYGDQERCVEMDEKPVALLRELDQSGLNPMFHLRKLAPSAEGGRTVGTAVPRLPGGVL